MVGGTREAVRWDQGDPPFPNVGAQQQQQQQQQAPPQSLQPVTAESCTSNINHAGSGNDSGKDVFGDGISFEESDNEEDDGEDEEDGRSGNIGEGAKGLGVRSGGRDVNGKEVRYAHSPTQSNPACPQIPLQRAHSRFLFSFNLPVLCIGVW